MAEHRQNQRRFPESVEPAWQILLKIREPSDLTQERALFQILLTDTPRMLTEVETQRDTVLTRSERRLLQLFVMTVGTVFLMALLMSPDPSGSGTHRQLGLPQCIIQTLTGSSCPHCGLTTSFCWLMRYEWQRSIEANPSGILLAVVLVYLGAFAIWIIRQNRWPEKFQFGRQLRYLTAFWLLFAVIVWFVDSV